MKKVIILTLSMLIPSCFLKANPDNVEMQNCFKENLSEQMIRLMAGNAVVAVYSLHNERKKYSEIPQDKKEELFGEIKKYCDLLDDSISPVQQPTINKLFSLYEEIALSSNITEDSINLYIDKMTTFLKESFSEETKTLSEKVKAAEGILMRVSREFLTAETDATKTGHAHEQPARELMGLGQMIRLRLGGAIPSFVAFVEEFSNLSNAERASQGLKFLAHEANISQLLPAALQPAVSSCALLLEEVVGGLMAKDIITEDSIKVGADKIAMLVKDFHSEENKTLIEKADEIQILIVCALTCLKLKCIATFSAQSLNEALQN